MTGRGAGDRGVAVVWSLALVSGLLVIGLASAGVGALAVARQRAATVADIAALAAAQALADPCGEATRVAAENQMSITACAADGEDMVVEVSAPPPATAIRLLSFLGRPAEDVRALARAGPPE